MSQSEWESLCDGCGKCCNHKIQDDETGEVYDTDVACKLLDTHTAQCVDYENRKSYVPDCIVLTAKIAPTLEWLPDTCSYKLVDKGYDLPHWHHLISKDRNTVHTTGNSVQDKLISENDVEDYHAHIEELFGAEIEM